MATRSVLGVPMLKGPEGGELFNQYPFVSGLLKGFMGTPAEEITGGENASVLDPENRARVERAREGANIGYVPGLLQNLLPVKGAVAGLAGLAKVGLAGKAAATGMGLAGAINIGGREDLILSHAMGDHSLPAIAKSGHLVSPSLGITRQRVNTFAPDQPQLIWRAGGLNAEDHQATILNRDGYFSNPKGSYGGTYDPQEHINQIMAADKDALDKFNHTDWRLLQSYPEPSQTAAIAASPNMKSFQAFEDSNHGAGALDRFTSDTEMHHPAWDDLHAKMIQAGKDKYEMADLLRRLNTGENPANWTADERKLWNMAKLSPSNMAEAKFRANVALNPQDAAIFLPENFENYVSTSALQGLQDFHDQGYRIVHAAELGQNPRSVGRGLAAMTPSDGKFAFPPRLPHPDARINAILTTPPKLMPRPVPPQVQLPGAAPQTSAFPPIQAPADLGFKIPTLGDLKPVPKVKVPKLPSGEVDLDNLIPPAVEPAQLSMAPDMGMGEPLSFAPAKKGWTKGAKQLPSPPDLVNVPAPASKVPKFKTADEAHNWMLDNGDEVLSTALDEWGASPYAKGASSQAQMEFLQHAADTAHAPGYMNQDMWHMELGDNLHQWLKAKAKAGAPSNGPSLPMLQKLQDGLDSGKHYEFPLDEAGSVSMLQKHLGVSKHEAQAAVDAYYDDPESTGFNEFMAKHFLGQK